MKIYYRGMLGLMAAALMVVSVAAQARPKQIKPAKPQQIEDLRPMMKQMKWKEGANVVYNGGGVKLVAELKGDKVMRWRATDDQGRSLPTQVSRDGVKCQVCVRIPTQDPSVWRVRCYDIDCDKAPAPKANA